MSDTVDKAGTQFRVLNRRKGPAVWVSLSITQNQIQQANCKCVKGPRALIDRKLYKKYMQDELLNYPNLTVKQGSVADIIINKNEHSSRNTEGHYGHVTGIKLESGEEILTRHLVITTGTFLSGEIHVGTI